MPQDHLSLFPVGGNLNYAKGVLLLDDASGTFNWGKDVTGGDDVHDYTTAAAFTGTNGIELTTRTTSAAEDDQVTLYRHISIPETGFQVLRCHLCPPDKSDVKQLEVSLSYHNGARNYRATFIFKPNTPAGYYINSAGAEVAISGCVDILEDPSYTTFEMSMNIVNLKYHQIMFNGTRYSLEDIDLYDVGASLKNYNAVVLKVIAAGANAAQFYVDNLYVGEFINS